MEKVSIESIIEAVLFASGDAISTDRLCEITQTDRLLFETAISGLIDRYNYEKRGIKILKLGDKYQMTTRGEYADYVQKIVPPRKRNPLSNASMEVLSIIAYKQPVTRGTVENVRGVNSDSSVSRLIELGLVEEIGKLDAPGRPGLLGTTDEFLRSFALSGIDELPPLDSYVAEEIANSAELRAQSAHDAICENVD